MTRGLTKKQKGFVKDYLDTGNGTQSALKNYDTDDYNTAAVIANENLNKPNVREFLEEHASEAASMVHKLSQEAEGEAVRLNASKDILDRAGYGAVQKSQSVSITVNTLDPKAIEIAKKYEEEIKQGL